MSGSRKGNEMKIKELERVHELLKENERNSEEIKNLYKKELREKYNTTHFDGILTDKELREYDKRKREWLEARGNLAEFEQMEFDERK